MIRRGLSLFLLLYPERERNIKTSGWTTDTIRFSFHLLLVEKRLTSSAGIIRGQPVLCATCSGAGLLMASSRCWELEKKKSPKKLRHVHAVISIRFFCLEKQKGPSNVVSHIVSVKWTISAAGPSRRTRKQMLYIRHGDDDVHYRKRGNHLLLKLREQLYRYYRDDVYTLYTLQQSINWLFFFPFFPSNCRALLSAVCRGRKRKKDGKWVYPRKKRNKGVSINFSYMPWQRTDVRTQRRVHSGRLWNM